MVSLGTSEAAVLAPAKVPALTDTAGATGSAAGRQKVNGGMEGRKRGAVVVLVVVPLEDSSIGAVLESRWQRRSPLFSS